VPPTAHGRLKRVVASVLDTIVPDWAVTPKALRRLRWIMGSAQESEQVID